MKAFLHANYARDNRIAIVLDPELDAVIIYGPKKKVNRVTGNLPLVR